jgi:peptidoglycan/xylan/chitin deacetylase (PgdA/CDA1 family)
LKLLIVNFHYFRSEVPRAGIYPIKPVEFEKQLEVLGKVFSFCSQADILRWLKEEKYPDGNCCLLTFDDGLREQQQAIDILKRKGIPAIFYIPVGPYKNGKVLAVHKLHHIRSLISDNDFLLLLREYGGMPDAETLKSKARVQYQYDDDVSGVIKYFLNFTLSAHDSEALIGQLFSSFVGDESTFKQHFYFTIDELKRISSDGMLGSHGTAHKPLTALSGEEMKRDIIDSVSYLEEITGARIESFSYPFGSAAAVNDTVARQVHEINLKFAVTMFRGINSEADLTNPFMLKRVDTNDAPGGKKPLKELFF